MYSGRLLGGVRPVFWATVYSYDSVRQIMDKSSRPKVGNNCSVGRADQNVELCMVKVRGEVPNQVRIDNLPTSNRRDRWAVRDHEDM